MNVWGIKTGSKQNKKNQKKNDDGKKLLSCRITKCIENHEITKTKL